MILFISNFAVASNLTTEGKKFFLDICEKDKFYENALEIVRRYQGYHKIGNEKLRDEKMTFMLVKELIENEEDKLFKTREDRNRNISDKQELLRYKIADLSFDIVKLSALDVFWEYKSGGDELRIKRRLNERCFFHVQKLIN